MQKKNQHKKDRYDIFISIKANFRYITFLPWHVILTTLLLMCKMLQKVVRRGAVVKDEKTIKQEKQLKRIMLECDNAFRVTWPWILSALQNNQ